MVLKGELEKQLQKCIRNAFKDVVKYDKLENKYAKLLYKYNKLRESSEDEESLLAAWNAARDAAEDARLYCFVKIVKSLHAKIAVKHIQHAEDRMDVWRRGFGLLCDVNGKLYVYAVGKKEDYEYE